MTDLATVVALLVTTVGTSNSLLGAVSLGVTLVTAVVALHSGSLDSLVGALVGPVAGLLTVVADLRPGLVAPLGRTVSGSVTESTAVVAVATGSAGTAVAGDTSLGAVTGHVSGLSALVTSAGRGGTSGSTTARAEGRDVAGLTAGVTGLRGLGVGAGVRDVSGLSALVTSGSSSGGAGGGLVGGVSTVVTSSGSVHL